MFKCVNFKLLYEEEFVAVDKYPDEIFFGEFTRTNCILKIAEFRTGRFPVQYSKKCIIYFGIYGFTFFDEIQDGYFIVFEKIFFNITVK